MDTMASQITSLMIIYSTVYLEADQRKHQSSASLAFVRGIHRWPVNSPHKGPVTRKMFPFDDVIMLSENYIQSMMLSWLGNAFPTIGFCWRDSTVHRSIIWDVQQQPRPHFKITAVFVGIRISIIKINRSWGSLIFIMDIPKLIKQHLHIETDGARAGSASAIVSIVCEGMLDSSLCGWIQHTVS